MSVWLSSGNPEVQSNTCASNVPLNDWRMFRMLLIGQVPVCPLRVRLIRAGSHLNQVTAHVACLRQVRGLQPLNPPLAEDKVHDVSVVVDPVAELIGLVVPGPPSGQRLPFMGLPARHVEAWCTLLVGRLRSTLVMSPTLPRPDAAAI
jgi:hypothetical protein